MIEGIEIKDLVAHQDERGFFCELIRSSDPFFKGQFGQLSHSLTKTGVFKAWHMHAKQTDWICAIAGEIKLGLYDFRKESKTFGQLNEIIMGEERRMMVKIPPGIAHGYKILEGPAHIIYVMNREYDPSDEIRIDHDDKRISYDWTK